MQACKNERQREKSERLGEKRLGQTARGSVQWRRRCRDATSGHARAIRRRAASRRATPTVLDATAVRELPSLSRGVSIGCAYVDFFGSTFARSNLTAALARSCRSREGSVRRTTVPTVCDERTDGRTDRRR